MMHLSVTSEQHITVVDKNGSVKQIGVADSVGEHTVYDWYGGEHRIRVLPPVKERLWMAKCSSGEILHFGESHTILGRKQGVARWQRLSPSELGDELLMVQLPQRKIRVAPELFDFYGIDDRGVYLDPPSASHILNLMRKAAWSGLAVNRRTAELRIDLEKNRPACFASKLINGGLAYNLDKTLGGLVASGVVTPIFPYNDAYLEKVNKTGLLFEGANMMNSVVLLPPRLLEKTWDVYHIELDDVMTPVELSWCSS